MLLDFMTIDRYSPYHARPACILYVISCITFVEKFTCHNGEHYFHVIEFCVKDISTFIELFVNNCKKKKLQMGVRCF